MPRLISWLEQRMASDNSRMEAYTEQTAPQQLLTWEQLCELEPLLLQLAAIVSRADVPLEMPEYWRRWESFKGVMKELVGWGSIVASLRTEEAYDAVHDHLLDIYQRRAAELSGDQEASE